MSWFFRVLDAKATPNAEDRIEIAVYDVIGKTIFGDGVSSADVLRALNAKPKAKSILVRVSSIGGILDDAKAMINLLAERAAEGVDVEFRVDSLAASAAAYLLTTPGARVSVADNAFVMIHKARAGMRGTHEDMDAASKILRDEDEILADAFADASARRGKKKSKKDYLDAVANNADRYFGADEAIEWGLADGKSESLKVAACAVDITELVDPPEMVRSAPYAQLAPTVSVGNIVTTVPTGTAVEATTVAEVVASAIQSALSEEPITPPIVAATDSGNAGKELSIMNIKVLATLLGLPETATEAEVTAELTKRLEPPQASVAVSGVKLLGVTTEAEAAAKIQGYQKSLLQVLGGTGKATIEEALALMLDWKTGAEQVTGLTKQIGQLTEKTRVAERDGAIERLSREGTLPPSHHEWARAQFSTGESVESFCAGIPKGFFAHMSLNINEPSDPNAVLRLTSDERKVCANLGITEELYLEQKKLDHQSAQARVGV